MPSKIIDTDVDDAVPLFPNLGEPLVVAVVALNGGSRDLPWHCSSSSSCSCSSVVSVVVGWWWSLLWWLRRRRVQSSAIFVPLVVVLILLYLVTHHPGVRRTIQFWKLTAPLMAEYQWLKFRVRHLALVEQDAILNDYHQRTAPTIFALVVQMRGIFVKIGQIVSSVGIGFVPDAYVLALRPLQDGVPPRTYDQIAAIIEASTGRSMSEVFLEFDPVPIGAASIAQAHRAILRQGREEVVIKVQYPDVAKLFEIDFDNLRALIRIVNPENLDLLHSLRRRHEQELDFTVEAENLREVRRNMQAHKVEPSLVRIPAVKNETGICSSTVLAIEYLPGISLKAAIADEQHRMALGLGMQNADELRQSIADRMRMVHNHPDRSNALLPQESPFNARQAKLLQTFGPAAARVLRVYGGVKEWYGDVWGDKRKDGKSLREKRRRRQHVKLGQAIKTLVHVHGLQMLQDGVFNVDPHPGNVLIMPDNRLGLLDYGMVSRVSNDERKLIASTVVALAERNKTEVARIYTASGYRAAWKEGPISDTNILHRFASFHFDRLDLSPVITETNERIDILHMLHSVVEKGLPTWIEKARRMGALMLGTASHAARPMSLSHEWGSMAKQVLAQTERRESSKK